MRNGLDSLRNFLITFSIVSLVLVGPALAADPVEVRCDGPACGPVVTTDEDTSIVITDSGEMMMSIMVHDWDEHDARLVCDDTMIEARSGNDSIVNEGRLGVTVIGTAQAQDMHFIAETHAEATSEPFVGSGIVDMGGATSSVRNAGDIDVLVCATSESYTMSRMGLLDTEASSASLGEVEAYGVRSFAAMTTVENEGAIDVAAEGDSRALATGTAILESRAEGVAGVSTFAAGIAGEESNVMNRAGGEIVVSASSHDMTVAHAAGSSYSLSMDLDTVEALASSDAGAFAASRGIDVASGSVLNDGLVVSDAEAYSDSRARSEGAHINTVWVLGIPIPVPGLVDSRSGVFSQAIADTAGVEIDSGGSVLNSGTIRAESGARAEALAEAMMYFGAPEEWRASAGAYAVAAARGVMLDGGGDLENDGTVTATSEASSEAIAAAGMGEDEETLAVAYAAAVESSGGSATVINRGSLFANASAADQATSFGVLSGEGADRIVNFGTISALETATTGGDVFETIGTAIETRGGDDDVLIAQGSFTTGDIGLGSGDDLLTFQDVAQLRSGVDGGAGFDTLVLDHAGEIVLDRLDDVEDLRLADDRLRITNHFKMMPDGILRTTISTENRWGALHVDDTLWLSGAKDDRSGPALVVTAEPRAYQDGETFDVVRSSGIVGRFAQHDLPGPTAFLDFSVDYTGEYDPYDPYEKNAVIDTVQVAVDVRPFVSAADNRVEGVVGGALDGIVPVASGDMAFVIGNFQLAQMPDVDDAFTSLGPGTYEAMSLVSYESLGAYVGTVEQRLELTRTEIDVPEVWTPVTPTGQRRFTTPLATSGEWPGWWGTGIGQWGDRDAGDGFQGFDYSMAGLTLGYDQPLEKGMIGGSLGAIDAEMDMDREFGDGDVETVFGSIYGGYVGGSGFVQAIASYADHDYVTTRALTVGELERATLSESDGNALSMEVSGGLRFGVRRWTMEPYSGLRWVHLADDPVVEQGAGSASLAIESRTTDSLLSDLGLRIVGDLASARGRVVPEFSVAGNYELHPDERRIAVAYLGAPDAQFAVDGRELDRFGGTVGLGVAYERRTGWTASVRYVGRVWEDFTSHSAYGGFRYAF